MRVVEVDVRIFTVKSIEEHGIKKNNAIKSE